MSKDGNGNGAAGVKKEDEAPSKRDSKKVRESSDVDSQIERKHINSRRKKSREKSDSNGDKSHKRKRKSRRRYEDSDSGSEEEEDESEGSGSEEEDSGSDSESEGERKKREKKRRREKEEEKKRRRREKEKKRRKKEKEEERRKEEKRKKNKEKKERGKKGAVTNLWGKCGVVRETDMCGGGFMDTRTKRPELTAWLSEVKQEDEHDGDLRRTRRRVREPPDDNTTSTTESHQMTGMADSKRHEATSDDGDREPLIRRGQHPAEPPEHPVPVPHEGSVGGVAEANDPSNVNVIDDPDSSVKPSKKRARGTRAKCWNYFTIIEEFVDGVKMVECDACNAQYKAGGSKYGTHSMTRHLEDCTKTKFDDVSQMMIDGQARLKSHTIDQLISREMYASAIIEHDLPFQFVEYKKIRAWLKYLNPDCVAITRNIAKADVLKIYMREKDKLRETLVDIPNRICLTSDMWTACTTEGYLCLTAHYVDKDWKLNSKILNFIHMPPPHSGFQMCAMILQFLKEWKIEKKIFSLTLDNASANDTLVGTLKNKLAENDNGLVADGQFFHVHCSAHILNLIVQDGLKVAGDALQKIRDSVKYVKGSETRKIAFKKCIAESGGLIDSSVELKLDMPIRWNSTYTLLETALKYKRAFDNLPLYDSNYRYLLSEQEWTRAQRICDFLCPFFQITELISGTSYPTANLHFMQVWKIQRSLLQSLNDEDEVIRKMSEKMIVKFEKYWDDYSVTLAMGAVLDPRMKLEMLRCCYLEIDDSTADEKVARVKSSLYMLFEKYATNVSNNPSNSNVQTQSSVPIPRRPRGPSTIKRGMFDELKKHSLNLISQTGKSQLDTYLGEPIKELDEELDVLKWWKGKVARFPDLSLMARDLLSIPITTFASESAFGIGERVLSKYRSRLLPKNVEALICTRNWLHGFSDNDDDDDDSDATQR